MVVGYNAFLPKPINWPDLATQLEKYLSLEWLYEEATAVEVAVAEAEIVLPSRADLEALVELTKLGSMIRIEAWAKQLAARDAQYQPLADKLCQLAGNFEVEWINQLARQYLKQTEG